MSWFFQPVLLIIPTGNNSVSIPNAVNLSFSTFTPNVLDNSHHVLSPGKDDLVFSSFAPNICQNIIIIVGAFAPEGSLTFEDDPLTFEGDPLTFDIFTGSNLRFTSFAPDLGNLLFPDSDISDGNWTDQNGGSSLFQAIDEGVSNDNDYIKSGLNPNEDLCEIGLSNLSSSASQPFEIFYRFKKMGGRNINLEVKLMQGAVVIATWTHNNISDQFLTASQTLSSGEFLSISDFNDLRVRFLADAA